MYDGVWIMLCVLFFAFLYPVPLVLIHTVFRQSSITAGPRPLAPGERRPSVPTAVPAVRRASTGGSSLPQHNLKKEEILLPWETPSEPCSPKEDLTTDGNGEDVERELRSSTGSTVAPPTKTAQPKTGDKAVHAVWSRAPSMTNASGDTDARRRSSLSGAMAVEPVDEQYIRQHAKMVCDAILCSLPSVMLLYNA